MNVKPLLKNVNKAGIGTVYIYLDFYTKSTREQIFFKTPVKVEKKHWNPTGKVKLHPNSKELNELINNDLQDVLQIVNEMKLKDIEVKANSLKEYKEKLKEGIKDLVTLGNEYVAGRFDASPRMKEKLNNLITRLDDFSKGKKLYYSQINQSWINQFTLYLQTDKPKHKNQNLRSGQQPSTIDKSFSFLKQILNHYHRIGLIDNKFKDLKYPKPFKVKQMVFEEKEIRKIIDFTPNRESIARVKDLALIQLFTGLRYSDAVKLNKSNIMNNQLSITTQKTNQNIAIPLHPALKSILEKYDYDLALLSISNQKYNKHLKSLIEEAGIDSKAEIIYFENGKKIVSQDFKYNLVGSHTFRRTFITNAIVKGIPLHVIQSITGHTTLKELSTYVNIADSIKASEMDKMNELFKVA
ncbi:site-specific integrase [Belliella sp. DSM 111904]|uniref:Site-specific integrase n=1 Tax=Belliella filtrata TaxID=2923435 RepID=A0ABS9V5F9_9BACT|nr:tyrosine-type recombinase/integrase [Belliella filtrata]MCH7411646.1 site-specific integrase [Belliella filtrata]